MTTVRCVFSTIIFFIQIFVLKLLLKKTTLTYTMPNKTGDDHVHLIENNTTILDAANNTRASNDATVAGETSTTTNNNEETIEQAQNQQQNQQQQDDVDYIEQLPRPFFAEALRYLQQQVMHSKMDLRVRCALLCL